MMYPIGILLVFAAASLPAAELAWDWPHEDARVTHFTIHADGAEISRTDDSAARSVQVTLTGGETLIAYACSESACSPPSAPLWVPHGVQHIRITWGLK